MSKYLELFKGAFDDSIGTKTKPENKPYIGYSLTDGKLAYTVVPKPVVGPADNEIWYTTSDGEAIEIENSYLDEINQLCENEIISNTYTGNYGIITFKNPVLKIAGPQCSIFGNYKPMYGDPTSGYQCNKNVISIQLPPKVVILGSNSFANCMSLTTINIPDGVTEIQLSSFYNTGLQVINLPTSVVSIGDGAVNVSNINYAGTISQWNQISKSTIWNMGARPVTVHCTDGDITL